MQKIALDQMDDFPEMLATMAASISRTAAKGPRCTPDLNKAYDKPQTVIVGKDIKTINRFIVCCLNSYADDFRFVKVTPSTGWRHITCRGVDSALLIYGYHDVSFLGEIVDYLSSPDKCGRDKIIVWGEQLEVF